MTINLITLGCSKNTVDSEKLLKQFELNGFEIQFNSEEYTDVVIINTCGFILDAKTESIEAILSYSRAKELGLIRKLFVIGCLSERYKNSLANEIPGVDAFFGVNASEEILSSLGGKYHAEFINSRVLTTPSHYAYLKISEGCNRSCAFCAIPLIRGRQVSVPLENIIAEANELLENGVKEIMLIAQDLTAYGSDIYKKRMLVPLVESLSEINGLEWIRLHYAYPENFPHEGIARLMNASDNLCHYLDIPFQHVNDEILHKMRRGHGKKEIMNIIDFFRARVKDVCLRTTLITGFPGETDKEFRELYDFVEEVRFERLGVFTYSHEENTPAGKDFKDSVPDHEKTSRMEEIMRLQETISLEQNIEKTGKTYKVIIDGMEGEFYKGRTEFDSPEIDQEVLIPVSENPLETGSFYNVKITDAMEFDLFGSVV